MDSISPNDGLLYKVLKYYFPLDFTIQYYNCTWREKFNSTNSIGWNISFCNLFSKVIVNK